MSNNGYRLCPLTSSSGRGMSTGVWLNKQKLRDRRGQFTTLTIGRVRRAIEPQSKEEGTAQTAIQTTHEGQKQAQALAVRQISFP